MPELPEVENVRQTLERHLVGQTVRRVAVRRADVITGPHTPTALLHGQTITRLTRHGKQLALHTNKACVCVHLGMSGSLRLVPPEAHGLNPWASADAPEPNPLANCATSAAGDAKNHIHVRWQLDHGHTLLFRDPRRFGGLWTFPSEQALHSQRWARLGDDALHITPARLHRQLQATRRALKAVLLDQTVIAGLGNIYVDELLFAVRQSPERPAATLSRGETASLVRSMRTLLRRAIDAGGSTLRDYVDGNGTQGGYQDRHRVYGRAGSRCRRRACQGIVHTATVAGRTTAWCPVCQPTTSEIDRATIPMEEKGINSLPLSSGPGAL